MFDDDRHLLEIVNNIRESIIAGFEAAAYYASTFEVYREFYSENERLDLEAVRRDDHGNLNFINLYALGQRLLVWLAKSLPSSRQKII